MPKEEGSQGVIGVVCIADVARVEDKTSVLITDKAVRWRIGCHVVPALVVLIEVQEGGQGLQSAANTTLRGDHWDPQALEVPHSVLQAHTIYLLVFSGPEIDLNKVEVIDPGVINGDLDFK